MTGPAIEKSPPLPDKEQYRVFFENFIGIAYQCRPDSPVPSFFFGTVEQITGYSSDDFVTGKVLWHDLIHPEDCSIFEMETKELISNPGYAASAGYRIINKSGEIRWVHDIGQAVKSDDGSVRLLQGAIYDRTPQMLTEEALRKSEEKYRTLFENAGDGILIQDGPIVIECNKRALKMFGCSSYDQMIGHTPEQFSPPIQADGRPSREVASERMERAFSGTPQVFEWISTRLDGSTFEAEVTLGRIDISDRPLLLAIVRDNTRRKDAENALRSSEARMSSIFRAAPIGIGVVVDRVFTEVNDHFCEMVGYSRAELIGKKSRMIYPSDEEFVRVGTYKYKEIREKGTGSIETRLRRSNGDSIDVKLSSTPLDPKSYNIGKRGSHSDSSGKRKPHSHDGPCTREPL